MRCIFTITLLAIAAAGLPSAAGQGAAWWNKDWEFRRMVSARHRKSGLDGQQAAWVTMPTNRALAKNARDLRVVTPSGAVLPHLLMRVGPDDLVTVAFPLRPAYGRYYIYYGNPSAQRVSHEWRPKRGVLLEGWQYPGGSINTLGQVRRVFERAARSYQGATFVPNIFLGLNPFSSSPRWCHRYTGYLEIKRAGDYGFATTSDDASFVLIDDKLLVGWGGRHGFRADAKHNKTIRLEPGLHKLTYLQVNAALGGGAVAAWRPPSKEPKWEVIPPSAFAPIVSAKLGKLERRNSEHQPDFVFTNAGEAFAKNHYTHRFTFEPGPGTARGSGVKYLWDFGDGITADRRRVEHIYLLPGSYDVKLTVTRGRNPAHITNRVRVERDWASVHRREIDDMADHLAALSPDDLPKLPGRHLWRLLLLIEGRPRFDGLLESTLNSIAQKGGDLRARHTEQLIGWLRAYYVGFREKPDKAADLLLALERSATAPDVGAVFATAAGRILVDDSRNLPRARQLYSRILAQYEDRAPPEAIRAARIGLGNVYRLDGDYERSRALYLQAGMKGDPRLADILIGHLQRSVEHFTKEGRLDLAEEMLDRWELDYPMQRLYGLSTLARMRLHIAADERIEAVRCGEALLAVHEDSLYAPEIFFELAVLHRRLRNNTKAVASLRALLDRHPESPLVDRARDLLDMLAP